MSTQAAAPSAPRVYEPASWLIWLYLRFTPSEGWYTLVILLGSLYSVVWTVGRADWVDSPSLTSLVTLSVLVGLVAAKLRRYPFLLHLGAMVGGAAVIYWQTAALSELPGALDRFLVLNSRVQAWLQAATGGGISTDTVVFVFALGGLTWITGYVSAWAIFRHRNLWIGVLPGAVGHLTNLSYLPDRWVPHLFLYLFFALLLAIRMTALARSARWDRQQVRYSDTYGPTSVYHAVWYVSIVVLIAALIPFQPPAAPMLRAAWNDIRSPLDDLELHVARLFSGLPSRKPTPFRTFGSYLPFQGAISLGDQPLFLVDSPSPSYWRSQAYATYTSQGWIAGDLEARPSNWSHPLAASDGVSAVTEMEYTVTSLFSANGLPMTALPVSAPAPFSVRVLTPESHWLPLDPSPGEADALPDDLAEALALLTRLYASGALGRSPADILYRALPADVAVTGLAHLASGREGVTSVTLVSPTGVDEYLAALEAAFLESAGEFIGVQVARRPPAPADVLGLTSPRRVRPGELYTFTSRRSTASEGQLRRASTNYPGWVTDTYLQLPESLPERVRDLAASITEGADNPYDMAVAIEDYLKTLEYDLKIPAPPFDGDGVDHHLFTLRRGYSDYFGSSMAVMLRATGVPARMVAGYASGEREDGSGSFVVRDRDSHGWAEAYFPGYGWIEFEPTPGRTLPAGPRDDDDGLASLLGIAGVSPDEEFLEEDLLVGETTISSALPVPGEGVGGSLAVAAVSVALAAGVVGLGLWLLYRRVTVFAMTPEAAFGRVILLGRLAGKRHVANETPSEFARRLGTAAPGAEDDLRFLGSAYAHARYGGPGAVEGESDQVARAWARVRRALLLRALWRLSPLR